ncbi:MAG: 30S ribosomal protein S2 [Deltaproteobacteria bacterium]|nr:30S ribosomal protein S2 [Deltaproteobacteria bacterium]
MADPTVEAPAASAAGGPESETAAAIQNSELGIRDLLEAGVHFGHQTRRWDPRMKRFLFGERSGVHIIDLDQTLPRFVTALDFIRETTASGGRVLFVATKRQAQAPIRLEAERAGQYYVNNRWLGGMLTNFKTVRKSIERFKELLELVADEEKYAELSKKDRARVGRWIEKYRKSLDGMREITRLPDAIFVLDVNREAIAVSEGRRLGIPIAAVVDSNCNPNHIDFVIPGNDDSIRAIQLYCSRVADACLEGAAIHNDRILSEVSEEEKARSAAPVASPTGRVVVEIKQPPRRGRGAALAEERRAAERAATEEPAAPAAETEVTTPTSAPEGG